MAEEVEFSKIRFGYSSAETESAEDPGLLLDGYVDLHNAFESAFKGSSFLYLGYKGAGKSTIGERLKLLAGADPLLFVRKVDLADFPFTPFSKLIKGDIEPEAKYPTAWSWIILIYALESLAVDEGMTHPDGAAVSNCIKAFRAMGLAPGSSPASLVKTAAKTSFKLTLPQLAEVNTATTEIRPTADIPNFVEALRGLISDCRSESRHFLVIDGLDDILTKRSVQFDSLGALMVEVNKLNQFFKHNNVPIKIIVVCRTDIFSRLSGANKNKIRQDYAVELDWYHNTREPEESMLVSIANMRASRSLGRPVDVFKEFFNGALHDGQDIRTALLDMTRHTPRDFTQILNYIQKFVKSPIVGFNDVRNGMRTYSIKYFLPEIKDEMSGYATEDEFKNLTGLFSGIKKRDFTFADLMDKAQADGIPLSRERVLAMLHVLFDCSAIGNIIPKPDGSRFYQFNYRNREASFDDKSRIVLHRGLWKAFNLV